MPSPRISLGKHASWRRPLQSNHWSSHKRRAMAIESINPATNTLLRHYEPLTEQAARQKIALAADAFRSYANVPLEHRALCMRKLAAILEHETEDLATLITLEMGKPLEAAHLEILKCADACRYYADSAARILAPESVPTEHN